MQQLFAGTLLSVLSASCRNDSSPTNSIHGAQRRDGNVWSGRVAVASGAAGVSRSIAKDFRKQLKICEILDDDWMVSIWRELDSKLIKLVRTHGTAWKTIQKHLPGVTCAQMRHRWKRMSTSSSCKKPRATKKRPKRCYSRCQLSDDCDEDAIWHQLKTVEVGDANSVTGNFEDWDELLNATEDATEEDNVCKNFEEMITSCTINPGIQGPLDLHCHEVLEHSPSDLPNVTLQTTTRKSPYQTRTLIDFYTFDPHPNEHIKLWIAEHLQLSVRQVNDWFANRRKRTFVG